LTKILAIVKGSNLDAYGKVAYSGSGMLDKKEAKRMDPEWFTYSPIEILYQLATSTSTTTLYFADTTFFSNGDVLVNTNTCEVAIVVQINSATVLTVAAVTSTWVPSVGDYVAVMMSSYEEGTSYYRNVTNELTECKTYLQIFREGVSIADTVKQTPQYTEEGMLERYMTDKMVQALRKMEASFLFSQQATSGGTTSVTTVNGYPTVIPTDARTYSAYTMKGLVAYAGTAINVGGAFNWEFFNTGLYPIMPKTLKPDETLYMVCGRQVAAVMNQWAAQSYLTMGSNAEGTRFGKKIKTFIMGGSLEVEPIVHELFDTGGFTNAALFFQSSDLVYRFMKGMDINIRENAQLPATMGQTNIVEGVVGLQCWSNGANVKLATNLFPGA
jgi:hypothetical protein